MPIPWNELLAEIYSNDELLAEFKKNPGKILQEKGIQVPEGVELKVVEDTPTVRHLVLPYLDPAGETSVEQIDSRISKIYVLGS